MTCVRLPLSSTSPLHLAGTHARTHSSLCLSPPVPSRGGFVFRQLFNQAQCWLAGSGIPHAPPLSTILHECQRDRERRDILQGFKEASGSLLFVYSPMARHSLSFSSFPFFLPLLVLILPLTYFPALNAAPPDGERELGRKRETFPRSRNNTDEMGEQTY